MNATLLSSYSGIKTHQFGVDSIANNIANVNTTGYRENQPQFQSLFSNSLHSLNANSPISNDYNYGATGSSNAISTRSGSYKASDNEFSVAYEGKGWFVVGENKNGEFSITDAGYQAKQKTYFTRDGNFNRDAEGYIVNSKGLYMYGVNLGKIQNNVFSASKNSDEDFVKLASGNLQPLQIPQDLYYKPVATTQVEASVNLNKTQNAVNATQVYRDSNGKFTEERFWQADLNAFAVNSEPIDATTFDKIKVSIKTDDKTQEFEFVYGKDFVTFKDLDALLSQKAGLGLDLVRLPDGEVGAKTGLKIFNTSFHARDIEISGSLAQKLGISGRNERFGSTLASLYAQDKEYEKGDLVSLDGVIFTYKGSLGNSNPFEDRENWEIVDTSVLKQWRNGVSYEVGSLVIFEDKVYRKVEKSENEKPTESGWEEIGDSKTGLAKDFVENESYEPKAIVRYQDKLYMRQIAGSSNPLKDPIGWKKISADSFESAYLEVPSYQSNVEIYDESGSKFLLQSHYYLLNSANSTTQPKQNELWEVQTQIFNKDGTIPVGEKLIHEIAFDENGTPITQPITLSFDNRQITYNLSGTSDKPSSNRLYQDSQINKTNQDGRSEGHLQDIRIDRDGIIFLSFSNGVMEPMGRVGISAFVNDQGLRKVGGNLFEMTESSGNSYAYVNRARSIVGWRGVYPRTLVAYGDAYISSGKPLLGWEGQHLRFGSILYKYLETSNVDVGSALTDLVVMQRGYSMNAKAFNTGDDLLKEAINLKR